jgi:hypothetical protein
MGLVNSEDRLSGGFKMSVYDSISSILCYFDRIESAEELAYSMWFQASVLVATGRRKFSTLRRDPIGAISEKIESFVRSRAKAWGKRRLDRCGVLDALAAFVAKRPKGSFKPDYADLWYLYKMVRKRKPRTVLEFGSGCSTVVLAKALYDNQSHSNCSGRLYSVDADARWADSTASCLPGFLGSVCEISYSPLLETEYEGIPALRHAKIPDVVPNFIYLDGPPLTPKRQAACDIVEIEGKFPSDFFLVIDNRQENTRFLRRHLKRRYGFKSRKWLAQPIFILKD